MNDLTVVIPAYRCGKYLAATVRSAVGFPGTPIIIGDDASGDDTLAVAQAVAKKFSDRIQVIAHPKNLGMTANWQNLLERVRTPLALKLDGDDIISAEYISAAVQLMRANPQVAITACASTEVDESFGLNAPPDTVSFRVEDFQLKTGIDAARFVLDWVPYPASASTVYRMETWRSIGGYDLRLNWCSDREIWFRMARQSGIAFTPQPGVWYRVLPTSATSNSRRSDLFCYELSWMLEHARKNWPERELDEGFQRNFGITSKAFFGSAVRAMKWGRWGQVLPRLGRGVGDFWRSL